MRWILILFFSVMVDAANVYVREGASGAATGADWTDALTDLPSSRVRGNTYYIADGAYAGRTFADATSGTTTIVIKKATAGDHGTETGWNSAYGDGQATFGPLTFNTAYYELNGVSGGGPGAWTNNLGFRISGVVEGFDYLTKFGANGHFVTISHTAIGNDVMPTPGCDVGGYSALGATNITYSYCHAFNIGDVGFTFLSPQNWLFEYSRFDRIDRYGEKTECGTGLNHGAGWEISGDGATNITIRHNLISNIEGTGWIGVYASGTISDMKIYGNVFFNTSDAATNIWGNGVIYNVSGAAVPLKNIKIYNNTFANLNSTTLLGLSADIGGSLENPDSEGNEFVNNIVWADKQHTYNGGETRSHNASNYLLAGDSSLQTLTVNPFINEIYFLLGYNTTQGSDVGATYETDAYGFVRDTWSRGAYEYRQQAFKIEGDFLLTGNASLQ